MAVVEEFCMAAKDKWPNCLIQFEDFQTDKAFAILERFRDKVLCFNGEPHGMHPLHQALRTRCSSFIPRL